MQISVKDWTSSKWLSKNEHTTSALIACMIYTIEKYREIFFAKHCAAILILNVVPTLEFKPTWAFFDIAVGYFRVVASAKFPAVIWGRIGAISLSRFCPVAACFRALRPLVPFTPVTMYCNPKSKAKIIEIMQLCFFTSYIHVWYVC